MSGDLAQATARLAARADATPASTAITVVVATYGRAEWLARCLAGLRRQTLAPTDVVVVVHPSDPPSAEIVDQVAGEWSAVRRVMVEQPGLVAALNRGLAAARGEIVAFVDDDAVPYADWLERIDATFASDRRIAAVGGRDVVEIDGLVIGPVPARRGGRHGNGPRVGRIQWFGRMIANHHVGVGGPRDVDVLKGVNMSFRRNEAAEIGFDHRLRGIGSQVHSELSICLPLRRRGARVVYDPRILVAHYPAPRPYGDGRESQDSVAVSAITHNETLAILDHFGPIRRIVLLTWGATVGTSPSPGIAVLARDLINGRRREAWIRFSAAQRGRIAACRTHLTTNRRAAVTTDSHQN